MQSMQMQKKILIISFLLIPMCLLGLFVVYPTLKLFQLSFTDWNGLDQSLNFIGLQNYKKVLLDSPDVWLSLKNNGIYFVIHLLIIPVEIFVAFLLDRKIKASNFFKTVVFMPYIINGVAVAYMFSFLYSSEGGALNVILESLNIHSVNWLSNPKIVNYSLAAVSLWRFCGMHIVLFLAALQSIPEDMLEASTVDGANTFQQFIKIILPNIKTVVEIVLFLNVRGALQVFDIPFVMTGGGPGHASSTFTLHTIETAFNFNSFGRASAMAVCLMILIILLSFVQNKLLGSKE
jgi:multiple sugar transport system permease protein